ncbi:fibronectin type III domain-containing protein [Parapedobacter sp. 10938]|uniref:fibronectin type III domain-containing protein n=1 Tax=Parapedobacter flavus TaxID=3110225 RepID=UPI002DBEA15F|nr:fibronectin type III domain-containing protein [Parapedobacter sp. 10938]MEC3879127.1 fibronectin type III domain-containing protein [Parapedobacter sp. 10938]
MVLRQQAISGFLRMRDDELARQTATIIQAMTDNANFATPVPDLPSLQAGLDDYLLKLSVATKRGGTEETALKNEAKEVLADLLRKLAFYVNNNTGGMLSVLKSSGFPTTDYPMAGDLPGRVYDVRIRDGRFDGEVNITFKPVNKVLFYEYRYALSIKGETEPQWGDPVMTTRSKLNYLTVPQRMREYVVQVRSVNAYGRSPWSDVAKRGVA